MNAYNALKVVHQQIKPAFNCQHYLTNVDIAIIEISHTSPLAIDVPLYLNPNWLKIELDSLNITPLNLQSKDSSTEIEERFFTEGYLKFSKQNGTFIEKFNFGQHALTPLAPNELPVNLCQTINNYLQHSSFEVAHQSTVPQYLTYKSF